MRQGDEDYAPEKVSVPRHLQRKAGLADATGPRKRQEPHLLQKTPYLF
jgi:hypothetical protein